MSTEENDFYEVNQTSDDELDYESYFESRRRKFEKYKHFFSLDDSEDSDTNESDNLLKSSSSYKIELIELTNKEKEKMEETQLEKLIETYKNSPTSKLNLYDDTNQDITIDENFINQNLNFYDQKIRISVIGSKQTGKSYFINMMTGGEIKQDEGNDLGLNNYIDIKKNLLNISGKKVKLEFIDVPTNLWKDKLVEKCYYSYTNCFIIIDTFENLEKLNSLKDQILYIKSLNSLFEILLIINDYKQYENHKKEKIISKIDKISKNKTFRFNYKCVNLNLCRVESEWFKNFIKNEML